MVVIQVALLIGVLTLLYTWLKFQQNYWLRRGIPHNPPALLKGNLVEWGKTKQISEIFGETYEKFKGQGLFAGFNFFVANTALIIDRDLIKNILIKDFHNFTARGIFNNEIDDPLTANLFFAEGEKWHRMRHKMTPTFTTGKMKEMFGTVVDIGFELVNVFAEKLQEDGNVIDVANLVGRYTADVIGTCAFGLECNSLRNEKPEFVEMGKTFINCPRHNKLLDAFINSYPKLAKRLRMRVIRDDVHEFYMRITRDTMAYREEHNIKRKDFMDMLIDLKNTKDGLSVEEVAAQSFVFFIAGYETSSTTMGFALYRLAKHVEIQNKLREEINEVLKKYDDKFCYDAMKEMHYLDQIINETLRMHPVIAHLIRRADKRYETSDPKFYIEAGTMVIIPTLGIHYDPEFYDQPNEFQPERFTPEAMSSRPACTWLPFGEGPRNCIGLRFGKMQTAIGLACLVKNFKFSFAPDTEDPPKLIKANLILGTENGVRLNVEKIN